MSCHRREQEAKEEAAALAEEARERERQLQEQINQLLHELGHKEGELEALRASKPKGWWSRLLGVFAYPPEMVHLSLRTGVIYRTRFSQLCSNWCLRCQTEGNWCNKNC